MSGILLKMKLSYKLLDTLKITWNSLTNSFKNCVKFSLKILSMWNSHESCVKLKKKNWVKFCCAEFTPSWRALIETFRKLWTKWGMCECRHLRSCARAMKLASITRRDVPVLWLCYDLQICFRELRDETWTG